MPERASDPIVLFSNGIPVSPEDLAFGVQETKEQIARLGRFSQMVNDIPYPGGKIWLPSGSKTWDVYDLVLSMAEFAGGAARLSANVGARDVAPEGFTDTAPLALASAAPLLGAHSAAPLLGAHAAAADLSGRVAGFLENTGFRFTAPPPAVPEEVCASIAAPEAPVLKKALLGSGPGASLASVFLKLRAQLKVDALTDPTGAAFYPTPTFPPDVLSVMQSWRPFELAPGDDDVWLPVPAGGKIVGETITVPLQRPWWSPWVFSNRAWRFDGSSGLRPLSNGKHPPQGMMPLYCSALLLARKVRTTAGPKAPAEPAAPAFTLRQTAGTRPRAAPLTAAARDAKGPMIFGFVCTALDKTPNPDPAIDWPR